MRTWLTDIRHVFLPSMILLAAAFTGCATGPEAGGEERSTGSTAEISRERAIEIARPHVEFEPRSIEATTGEEEGRPVWRVTFRGRPPGPEHAMGEFQEIVVDRRTGEIVALAMS